MSDIVSNPKDQQPLTPLAEQGVQRSQLTAKAYVMTRLLPKVGIKQEHATVLGLARLKWILKQGQKSISKLFTEEELTEMLDCFQGRVFCPADIEDMPGMLTDKAGVETAVCRKVSVLDPMQRLVLADALEQTWYSMDTENAEPAQKLKRFGIALKDQ